MYIMLINLNLNLFVIYRLKSIGSCGFILLFSINQTSKLSKNKRFVYHNCVFIYGYSSDH